MWLNIEIRPSLDLKGSVDVRVNEIKGLTSSEISFLGDTSSINLIRDAPNESITRFFIRVDSRFLERTIIYHPFDASLLYVRKAIVVPYDLLL